MEGVVKNSQKVRSSLPWWVIISMGPLVRRERWWASVFLEVVQGKTDGAVWNWEVHWEAARRSPVWTGATSRREAGWRRSSSLRGKPGTGLP